MFAAFLRRFVPVAAFCGDFFSVSLNDCWIDDTEEHITDEAIEQSSAKVLPENTVLLAMYGATVGQLGIARRAITCNQASCALIADESKAHFRYLYYLLLSERHQIKSLSTGAAQQNLSAAQIKQFRFPFPKVEEQRAIAHILGTLDDKIELNRRMNETLEAMARAIFKSWFVDFDPVRAKASGEPHESICRRLGLTPDVLALFPDSFQDSELGEIPKGWRTGTIAEHCSLNVKSWTAKNMPDELRYVDLANAKSGVISEVQVFVSADAPSRARRVLHIGDTIVGTVRPGNRSYALIGQGPQLTGSTGFAVLTPKRNELREFVYLAATNDDNIDRLSRLADGAAYPAVRPDVVTRGTCVVPPGDVVDAFHEASISLIDSCMSNTSVSATLASLRDTLLPKLLSGELQHPSQI